jgi:ATP-binding cassette subfamily F protein uup
MAAPRNLVNLSAVEKGYGSRSVLRGVTLGVAAGERIGVVGRNGDGKSTLLRLLAGMEEPDAGEATRTRGISLELLGQRDELGEGLTARDVLVGSRADHEWAGDAAFRAVLDGLLGGVGLARLEAGLETGVAGLSGGERRRLALARTLLDAPELLLLDEPTNHLDVEGVDWLARHLAARRGALAVVTHDRWFLDAVCTATWEVIDGGVEQYEGGYAAYTLARAERERVAAVREDRRQSVLRKELAWLRRGPPARTSKPRFRRDSVELLRFATARLGDKVLEAEDVSLSYGGASVLQGLTWRLGPGDRVALVGVNGSGKTTLLRLLAGELEPDAGEVQRGLTVRLAHLSQDTRELPVATKVLEAVEDGSLRDRFGFRGEKAWTAVGDLSGGERRRLQLMRLLMEEPNVLLLDEPTNDLDVDTLAALEDLLDGWPGTLVVVSHDRYFVERVCDDVYALDAGAIRHLPGGVDQYLAERRADVVPAPAPRAQRVPPPGAVLRAARKDVARLERALERASGRETALQAEMAAAATDHVRLRELQAELGAAREERERLEAEWLEAAALLEE